jgi:hypothetical protein
LDFFVRPDYADDMHVSEEEDEEEQKKQDQKKASSGK